MTTFIEKNKNKIKQGNKEYFDKMIETIMEYDIPFQEFKAYFIHLRNAIKHNFVDNYMYYLVVLYNAGVTIQDNELEKEEYESVLEGIETIMIGDIKKEPVYYEGTLNEKFDRIIDVINNGPISLDNYKNFCELFKIAVVIDESDYDYITAAEYLLKADVIKNNTYDDAAKYYKYQLELMAYMEKHNKKAENKKIS